MRSPWEFPSSSTRPTLSPLTLRVSCWPQTPRSWMQTSLTGRTFYAFSLGDVSRSSVACFPGQVPLTPKRGDISLLSACYPRFGLFDFSEGRPLFLHKRQHFLVNKNWKLYLLCKRYHRKIILFKIYEETFSSSFYTFKFYCQSVNSRTIS